MGYELHQHDLEHFINALERIEKEYPAVYKHFFLSELRKENFFRISEEDAKKLGLK